MEQHAVVLMSTYNGQTYLKEQLDCIFDQTFSGNITVLIRDDGSKDDTEAIALSYPQTENRKITFIKADNVGPQRSFLELIRLAPEADYYFFADQDDVWDLDKIEIGVTAMAQETVPVSYCSNFRHTHMDLTIYEEQALRATPNFSPLSIIFYNQIPGCVMGFNWELMDLMKQMELQDVMMHDSMALSLAAACGKVIYDPQPRISHRIHASNVVGHGHKKIVLHKWIPEKLKLLAQKDSYDLSEMADAFVRVAADRLHPQYREDVLLLRDFKKSFANTLRLLKHPDSKGSLLDRTVLSIRCKILFHIF